jgi:hypothetical protein
LKPNNLHVEKISLSSGNRQYAYVDLEYHKNFAMFDGDEKFIQKLLEKSTILERKLQQMIEISEKSSENQDRLCETFGQLNGGLWSS